MNMFLGYRKIMRCTREIIDGFCNGLRYANYGIFGLGGFRAAQKTLAQSRSEPLFQVRHIYLS
jgi:hypothetical protein